LATREPATPFQQKTDPKLRLIGNGSNVVNTLRAERSDQVAVQDRGLLDRIPRLRGPVPAQVAKAKELDRGSMRGRLPTRALVNVFVTTGGRRPTAKLPGESARRDNIILATKVPVNKLRQVSARTSVASLELADALVTPQPSAIVNSPGAPSADPRRIREEKLHHRGQGILIGIIDIGGFDFSHSDFLDAAGKTRWVQIWDQGGTMRPPPSGFAYGSEISGEQMNRALRDAKKAPSPPI
jgi:hypothetical protein